MVTLIANSSPQTATANHKPPPANSKLRTANGVLILFFQQLQEESENYGVSFTISGKSNIHQGLLSTRDSSEACSNRSWTRRSGAKSLCTTVRNSRRIILRMLPPSPHKMRALAVTGFNFAVKFPFLRRKEHKDQPQRSTHPLQLGLGSSLFMVTVMPLSPR